MKKLSESLDEKNKMTMANFYIYMKTEEATVHHNFFSPIWRPGGSTPPLPPV